MLEFRDGGRKTSVIGFSQRFGFCFSQRFGFCGPELHRLDSQQTERSPGYHPRQLCAQIASPQEALRLTTLNHRENGQRAQLFVGDRCRGKAPGSRLPRNNSGSAQLHPE